MKRWYLLNLLFLIPLLCLPSMRPCEAKGDVRLALLVGNQTGWKKDPKLHYAISGDLKPVAQTIKGLGFKLHAVMVNQSPESVRRAMRSVLQRLQQKPRVSTFFFYYSGHADKTHFHLGPKGKDPLSYREFVQFLNKIKVRRRFVVLDACFSGEVIRQFGSLQQYQTLRKTGQVRSKGVSKKLVVADLRKYFPDQGIRVRGLQILSSSQHLSFESNRRSGSVFTYHLLQGLKGAADLDRDGKIGMNELFLYAKPRVKKETGQNPQQWLFRVGGETYGFAPVYRSYLDIHADTLGKLQVTVDNFVWRWNKQARKPIRLAVTDGEGLIELQRGRRCWQQRVSFVAHQKARLRSDRWSSVSCSQSGLLRKGSLELSSRVAPPLQPENHWSLELSGGPWGTNGFFQNGGELLGSGRLGLRHRFGGIFLGFGGATLQFADLNVTQLLLNLRGEGGYRKSWGRFDLFVGGYLSLGTLLQDINQDTLPSLMIQVGATVTPAFWLSERWAITLTLDAGVLPTIVQLQSQVQAFFVGAAHIGLRYRFGGL